MTVTPTTPENQQYIISNLQPDRLRTVSEVVVALEAQIEPVGIGHQTPSTIQTVDIDDFYAYASQGLETIPARNRRAIHIAVALYQGIGRKILRVGPQRYWEGRVHLSRFERSGQIVRAILRGGLARPVAPGSAAAANFLQQQMMLQLQLQGAPACAGLQFST